jgi:single-strand DNA-binding protein
VSTRAWTANNGELRSSLNFHTSSIKLHGGSKKITHTHAIVKQENTKIMIQEPIDDLPF